MRTFYMTLSEYADFAMYHARGEDERCALSLALPYESLAREICELPTRIEIVSMLPDGERWAT